MTKEWYKLVKKLAAQFEGISHQQCYSEFSAAGISDEGTAICLLIFAFSLISANLLKTQKTNDLKVLTFKTDKCTYVDDRFLN